MELNFSDILEVNEMNQIRSELDILTSELINAESAEKKQILSSKMKRLIDKLEKHGIAIKKSMLIPIKF